MVFAWIVIGNPENRRVKYFIDALHHFEQPLYRVFSYTDLLCQFRQLPSLPLEEIIQENDCISKIIIRIESPGENLYVERAINLLNEKADENKVLDEINRFGEYRCQKNFYIGYSKLLLHFEKESKRISSKFNIPVTFMNHPTDILRMFDKRLCSDLIKVIGVPVPSTNIVNDIIIKPNYGSSACGCLAIRLRHHNIHCYSTIQIKGDRFFNSLKVKKYRAQDYYLLHQLISKSDHVVQVWHKKAEFPCQPPLSLGPPIKTPPPNFIPLFSRNKPSFDLRIVVINGKVLHTVVRTSHSPFTNLHLGNPRGSLETFYYTFPKKSWITICKGLKLVATTCFPQSLYMGFDVLIDPEYNYRILEVNAYGDLLPRVLIDKMDTYHWEVKEMLEKS